MKKIGILTYHTGFNYGASLQAYALQTVIKRYCNDCEIINFESMPFVASREMFCRKPTRIKEWVKIVSRLPYYKVLSLRQKLFEDYTEQCLDCSPCLRTEQEVVQYADKYDCIVCGSDQIWNLMDLSDPAGNLIYFLNFPKKQRRISYAASFGKWVKRAPAYESEFLPWLRQFDALSVRETNGADYLHSLGLPCEVTIDPTFLLDASEYEKICEQRLIQKPYILLFSWDCSKSVLKAAKTVAKALKLPIYQIVPPPRAVGSGIRRKLDVGPREFLSLIKYADFVVTNSFHGTAFATTFHKPYISVYSENPDPRMESLLRQLGLQDHLVTDDGICISLVQRTDFDAVEARKVKLRNSSMDFLLTALEIEQ